MVVPAAACLVLSCLACRGIGESTWRVRRARVSFVLIFTAVLVALCGAVGSAQAQENSQHRLDIRMLADVRQGNRFSALRTRGLAYSER